MSSRLTAVTATCVAVMSMHAVAQQPRQLRAPGSMGATSTAPNTGMPHMLPGTRTDVFATIQGNALTPTGASLPNAFIRLRDARVGQIVGSQLTDSLGLFAFRSVDPGSYIVEIVGTDRSSVLAASQVLNVGAGEALSAVVKLPYRVPPLAGIFGNTIPSAATVAAQAAASGVLATQVSGAATCDTLQ